MALPTLEHYNEAVQNPDLAFFDPELKRGKVKKSVLGIPFAACGGFALTYTITSGVSKYAVRCFHKDAKDREKRYAAISAKLSGLKSGYFVGFKFQNNGIKVKGQSYPIVKMSWANGDTIGEFIAANFKNKNSILALRHSVLDLAAFLEKNHIAHGDIQPGNLMVAEGGKSIQLIDYDGMYLPEISYLTSAETGHRNFQHPDRARLNPWNERSDRFSFILLSTVLQAIAINPQLWINSKSDGDKFLIGANDFVSPHSSKIFSELSSIPSMKDHLEKFKAICCGSYDAIPSLADFLNTPFQIQTSIPSPTRNFGYISTYPVLDAQDYSLCLKHVGDVVELVGKVVEVSLKFTKGKRPYYFLNFANWRGNAVKITVWPSYLTKSRGIDFKKFEGKFISVIGLMQPPYHGKSQGIKYTHLSIFLDTTINEINEGEAQYRLNYEKNLSSRGTQTITNINNKSSNMDILKDIRKDFMPSSGGGASSKQRQSTTPSNRKISTNKDILNDILQNNNASTKSSNMPKTNNNDLSRQQNMTNTSFPSNISNTKKDVYVSCPYCNSRNNVGTSGVLLVKCIRCNKEFEYSHYTNSITEKNDDNTLMVSIVLIIIGFLIFMLLRF